MNPGESHPTAVALAASEARLDRCVRGTLDGLWDWDTAGREFWGSPRFWELLGLTDHSETGTLDEWNDWMHPDDFDPLWQSISRYLNQESDSHSIEVRLRVAGGQYRWFHTRALAVRDESGRAVRLAGSIRDIQDRKELEFSLRRQVAERDRFLAVLSHELRNPLTAVKHATRVGLDAADDPALQHQAFEIIHRQTRHMARLLDDLLAVSRITLGTFEMRMTRCDLREISAAALETIAAQVEEKQHRLITEEPDQPVWLRGDHERLVQAQVNLLANAARFTPPGGTLRHRLHREGDMAVITVSDSGIGLEPELSGRLFEPFVRGENELTRREGGMGLGLSLVRSIVEAHGGTVTAHSSGPGEGSVFEIRLPLSTNDRELQTTEPTAKSPATPPRPLKVLLIDDMQPGRRMLARWLERRGLTVLESESGEAGLQLAEQHPDLEACVVDIGLPGLSGVEVARQLRRNPATRQLHLIALTGYGREEDRVAAVSAGFDEHLRKPADLDELLKLILRGRAVDAPAIPL